MHAVVPRIVAAVALWSLVVSTAATYGSVGEACAPPRIAGVRIVRHDVFAPAETDGWLARTVNKLHVDTRHGVVQRELLFTEGELLDPEKLAQTERNLRERPFLSEVRVEVLDADGATVATAAELTAPGAAVCELLSGELEVLVRVTTQDAWSTSLETTFRQAGDRTIWELGVEESNLLGRGKSLGFAHRHDLDRSSRRLTYVDPQLAGTRHRLAARVADQSDGSRVQLEIGRPFYSLDDRWSWELRLESFDQSQPLYESGEEIRRLRHVRQWQELEVSRRIGRTEGAALRLHGAVRRRSDEVQGARREFGVVEIGVSSVEHRYVQLRHVNHARPIDINLGAESWLRLGISLPALGGGSGTPTFLRAGHRRGLRFGAGRFLLGELSWNGRFRGDRVENGMLEARATFLDRTSERHLSLATARLRAGTRLDAERQVTLGAHNGLRGYPVYQWAGNRSLLLGLEHRWFFADDVLEVASLGVAAFADSGYAWPERTTPDLGDLRTNVGVSLLVGRRQLATSRAGMRIDLAYALDPVTDEGRWLLSVGRVTDID